MTETKQKLPKWFNGELYDEGAEVQIGLAVRNTS